LNYCYTNIGGRAAAVDDGDGTVDQKDLNGPLWVIFSADSTAQVCLMSNQL